MTVAQKLRRNKKMTMTTRTMVKARVNWTSATAARMVWVRSLIIPILIAGGIAATSRGSSDVQIYFDWGTDVYQAKLQIESRLNEIRNLLPAGTNIAVEGYNQSLFPVYGYTLESHTIGPIGLRDIALSLVVCANRPEASAKAQVEAFAARAAFPVTFVHEPQTGVANARNAAVAIVMAISVVMKGRYAGRSCASTTSRCASAASGRTLSTRKLCVPRRN